MKCAYHALINIPNGDSITEDDLYQARLKLAQERNKEAREARDLWQTDEVYEAIRQKCGDGNFIFKRVKKKGGNAAKHVIKLLTNYVKEHPGASFYVLGYHDAKGVYNLKSGRIINIGKHGEYHAISITKNNNSLGINCAAHKHSVGRKCIPSALKKSLKTIDKVYHVELFLNKNDD